VLRTALLVAALALAGSGCATPCEDLGRRLCACQAAGAARDACDRAVRDAAMDPARTSAAQQDFCDATLETCPNPDRDSTACEYMQTCQGKVACGLAAAGSCGP
jgi:hypothetical protein